MKRSIPGFTRYMVDETGQVFGMSGGPLKPTVSTSGYLVVSLRRDGKTYRRPVHRLVLMAFVGPGNGLDCCHANGDKLDNRLSNLRWGTRSENILDQVRHGRHNNARKTHCKRGHAFVPENTYQLPGGRRQCITCTRAAVARNYKNRTSKEHTAA